MSKIYHSGEINVHALNNVSLVIESGEYVAIMGQSGSGKSTLMHILGCLDQPSAGTYRVGGQEVENLTIDELAALRRDMFGFVFQRYNLLPTASALENTEIPAIYAGHSRRERAERARAILKKLGLDDREDHRPGQLSGGQQQRVSIARALMNNPSVILADEPTGALDSESGQEVLELLDQLNAEGRTIILITHDPQVAARAKRVIQIHDGEITEDSRTEIQDRKNIALLDGEVVEAEHFNPFKTISEIGEAVKMALRSLRANFFRTALTLLGVVIGVAAVVTMLAIGDGSKQAILERIESMGTNLLLVRAGAPGMRSSGDVTSLVPGDAEALAQLPNVEVVVPERGTRATIRFGNLDHQTTVNGVWEGLPRAQEWDLTQGSFFTHDEVNSYAPVIVLGKTVKETLFPAAPNPVGRYVMVKNIPFEVIGVLSEKGASPMGSDMDDVAFVPLSTGLMRLFGQQHVTSITVKVADKNQIDATEKTISDLLLSRHRTEDFQIRNRASLLEMVEETQNTLTLLLGSVAAISLLVGGIGVMNIMLVSVTERTREIGIRMATGARMRDILIQFNTEALVVCGIGGVIGILTGLSTAAILSRFGVSVAYSVRPPLIAFLCAAGIGLIFGYLPARKAARLDPVVALSSE